MIKNYHVLFIIVLLVITIYFKSPLQLVEGFENENEQLLKSLKQGKCPIKNIDYSEKNGKHHLKIQYKYALPEGETEDNVKTKDLDKILGYLYIFKEAFGDCPFPKKLIFAYKEFKNKLPEKAVKKLKKDAEKTYQNLLKRAEAKTEQNPEQEGKKEQKEKQASKEEEKQASKEEEKQANDKGEKLASKEEEKQANDKVEKQASKEEQEALKQVQEQENEDQMKKNIMKKQELEPDKCPLDKIKYFQRDGKYILKVRVRGAQDYEPEREFDTLEAMLHFWKYLEENVTGIKKCQPPFQEEFKRLKSVEKETEDVYQQAENTCQELENYLKKINRGQELTKSEREKIKTIRDKIPELENCRQNLNQILEKMDKDAKNKKQETKEDQERIKADNESQKEIEKQIQKAMKRLNKHRDKIDSLGSKLESVEGTLQKNTSTLEEISNLMKVPEFKDYADKKSLKKEYDQIMKDMDKSRQNKKGKKSKKNKKQEVSANRLGSKGKGACPTFPYEYPASLESIGEKIIGFEGPWYQFKDKQSFPNKQSQSQLRDLE